MFMDAVRARSALCACVCLTVVGSSTMAYAFAPSLQHVSIVGGVSAGTRHHSSSCCSKSRNDARGASFGVKRPAMAVMALGRSVQRENGEALSAISVPTTTVNRTERGQRLRALNWVKQVRNELTSAEFALNLVAPIARGSSSSTPSSAPSWYPVGVEKGGGDKSSSDSSGGGDGAGAAKGSGTEIDYDSIAERLEASLRTLQGERPVALRDVLSQDELNELTERLKTDLVNVRKVVGGEARGVGGINISSGVTGTSKEPAKGESAAAEDASSRRDAGGMMRGVKSKLNVDLKDVKVPEFDLFVRDDGTVDWDGAIQSGREVARFGQELWDRINGQNPHEEGALVGGGYSSGDKTPRDLPEDSEVMQSLGTVGAVLDGRVEQLQKELDALKADARAQERSWSGVELRNAQRRIREEEKLLKNAKRQSQLHSIDVDMERICYLIEQDIRESTSASPSENRLLVAEFGLLDAQLANLKRVVADMTGSDGLGGEVGLNGNAVELDGLVLDEDELELVSREVLDLKNRLGMDLENPALSIDPEKVTRYIKETVEKIRSGVDFYWTGTKILGNDVGYALSLVTKAAQGSILKPREVRTLRRTGKDCLTFIPFVIILILPLTPVGHVLIFSFIQRFFPDFFPSTYTDRRQNLLKMYTEVEKKVDWEDADAAGGADDILEKLRRNFTSTLNQVGDQSKSGDKHKNR